MLGAKVRLSRIDYKSIDAITARAAGRRSIFNYTQLTKPCGRPPA
jgi:hypothetical protein